MTSDGVHAGRHQAAPSTYAVYGVLLGPHVQLQQCPDKPCGTTLRRRVRRRALRLHADICGNTSGAANGGQEAVGEGRRSRRMSDVDVLAHGDH